MTEREQAIAEQYEVVVPEEGAGMVSPDWYAGWYQGWNAGYSTAETAAIEADGYLLVSEAELATALPDAFRAMLPNAKADPNYDKAIDRQWAHAIFAALVAAQEKGA